MKEHIKFAYRPVTHISHFWQHISAYAYSHERLEEVVRRIEDAVNVARETRQTQIVDDDGEMCLHVHPAGSITLMIPWESFELTTL